MSGAAGCLPFMPGNLAVRCQALDKRGRFRNLFIRRLRDLGWFLIVLLALTRHGGLHWNSDMHVLKILVPRDRYGTPHLPMDSYGVGVFPRFSTYQLDTVFG